MSKMFCRSALSLIVASLTVLADELPSANTPQFSGNPIFRNFRTADASPIVGQDGRLWVYTSGDHPESTGYKQMDHYRCYSTDDMVNWTYHGVMLSASDLSWRNPDSPYMFAPDIAYKDGKYYLYFPHNIGRQVEGIAHGWRIGVAISEAPTGPFVDIGHPIKGPEDNPTGMQAFDPHCFIDDDGSAYLYWGFGQPPSRYAYVARLKDNMIELAEEPRQVNVGARNFFEAAFLHKREGRYYFSYTSRPGLGASYGIGDSPYGPFVNHGRFAPPGRGAQAHPGIVEYKDKWYYFYHRGDYELDGIKGTSHRRVVCVDELYYNPDGTIKPVKLTEKGVQRADTDVADKKAKEPAILPKVLIFGDSISGGYSRPLIKALEGKAEVIKLGSVATYRINEQAFWRGSGKSKSLDFGSAKACVADLERFTRHLSETRYDVIHFNFGLNDSFRGRGGKWHNPVEQYAKDLEKIVTLLKTNGARVIWSNTTPIPANDLHRPAGDDLLYNAAAEKVMKAHGIPINDLHSVVTGWEGYAKWNLGGDVHFSPAVYTMLAETIARAITAQLEADVTKATLRPLAPPPGEDVPREPIEREYLERAKAGAVAHRQVEAELTFLDQHGKPLRGAVVSVRQTRHEFLFGCIGFDLVPNLKLGHIKSNPPKTPEDLALWKKRFSALFNYTTLPFYWRSYEKAPGKPEHWDMDEALAWLREEGITVRGHPLIWTHKDGRPSWYGDKAFADINLLTGEVIASELEKDADLAVSWRELVLHRVRREVGQFAGQIDIWDIYNEAAFKRKGNAVKTAPLIHAACCAAKEANPNVKLILNDAGMFSDDDRRDGLYRMLLELKRLGTPLGGLGFQAHIPDNGWWVPERMIDTLDQFAELGWPIHITEFIPRANGAGIRGGWRSGKWTAKLQADCAEFFYRLWFGHPAVASVNWWGLSDRSIWLGNGGLIDEQYNPKPVYERLDGLINDEWRTVLDVTTDDLGRIRFRGFKGDYELKVQLPGGTEQTFTTTLAGGTPHQKTFQKGTVNK